MTTKMTCSTCEELRALLVRVQPYLKFVTGFGAMTLESDIRAALAEDKEDDHAV